MFGCYRKGDANDPDVYVTAVTAVLAHYGEAIITEITNPFSGLPAMSEFLPTVSEVKAACETLLASPRYRNSERIEQQMKAREEFEKPREIRPSYAELKARYGERWGIEPPAEPAKRAWVSPTWEQIDSFYKANPERAAALVREREEGER